MIDKEIPLKIPTTVGKMPTKVVILSLVVILCVVGPCNTKPRYGEIFGPDLREDEDFVDAYEDGRRMENDKFLEDALRCDCKYTLFYKKVFRTVLINKTNFRKQRNVIH